MPYLTHTLASFRGHFGPSDAASNETWSFGLRYGTDIGNAPISQAIANQLLVAASGFIINTGARFSNDVFLDEVRLYNVGTNGKAVDEVVIAATSDVVRGTVASPKLPWQCSNVITLQANGVGKGRYGRIYLPTQAESIGPDGLLDPGFVNATLAAVTSFLNATVSVFGGDNRLVVIGKTGLAGSKRMVRHVKMGRVVDTQRRRRRSLDETYIEQLAGPAWSNYALAGGPV